MRFIWLALLSALFATFPAVAQTASSEYTTHYRYDEGRRVVGTISSDPDGTTGNLDYPATRITYDSYGRVIREESGELANWQAASVAPDQWSGFSVYKKVDTEYDEWGRPVKKYVIHQGGDKLTLTGKSYDDFGRVECVVQRMNPTAFDTVTDDACVLGTTGDFGPDRITKTVYDDFGRVTTVKKAVGTSLEQDYQSYTYYDSHAVETVTDANGNTSKYNYDEFNRLKKWLLPSKTITGDWDTANYELYQYDDNSNRTYFRNRAGEVIRYEYDDLNRMTRRNVTVAGELDVYYGYDLRGLELYARFGSTSGDGIENSYDGFGRLRTTSSALTGSKTLTYEYDANGNRTQLTHPDAVSFQYEYDGLDRVTRLRENTSSMVTQNYYRSGMPNRTAHIDHFNLRVTDYDKALRPTQMTLDIFYDGMTHDLTEDFAYNPASQVTEYTVDITDYLYTGNDNLDGDYTVNGLNQYTDVDGETYDYDDKGNLTDIGTDVYSYDSLNRMTSALGVSLKYDPYGRLYEIDTGSAVTRFVYDGDAMVLELDGNNTIQGRYVHGPGVDQPLVWYDGSSVGATERRHLAADRQGSIIAVSTSTTSAPHINSYDVFGIPDAGNLGRFSYTGQIWLPEIGLMYYKARIYNPQLGRFMQTDPIGYDDQMNMYAYVGNDPMNMSDPSGEVAQFFVMCAGNPVCRGAAIGGAVGFVGDISSQAASGKCCDLWQTARATIIGAATGASIGVGPRMLADAPKITTIAKVVDISRQGLVATVGTVGGVINSGVRGPAVLHETAIDLATAKAGRIFGGAAGRDAVSAQTMEHMFSVGGELGFGLNERLSQTGQDHGSGGGMILLSKSFIADRWTYVYGPRSSDAGEAKCSSGTDENGACK